MAKPTKRRKTTEPDPPSFHVDEDTVTLVAGRHAQDFYEWKIYCAKLEAWVEAYEETVENALGPLRDQVRVDIIASRGRNSLTEKSVNDSLLTRPKVRAMLSTLRKRNRKLKLAKAVLAALDKKTEMIKAIAYAVGRSHAAGL